MNALDFQNKVKSTFLDLFPNGHINIKKYCLGGGIHFSLGLIGNIDDVSSKIRQNDPMNISFGIHEGFVFNSTDDVQDKIVIEFTASSISTVTTNQYYAMESHKIKSRKINNTPEKALISVQKYFAEVKKNVDALVQENKIYNQDRIPEKYL